MSDKNAFDDDESQQPSVSTAAKKGGIAYDNIGNSGPSARGCTERW